MGKVILITGSESLLGRKLVEKALKQGYFVIAPVGSKATASNEPNREDLLVLPWNRSSVFSAKTIVREGIRKQGLIDTALFINPTSSDQNYLLDMSVTQVDEHLDNTVRGLIYLVKELLSHQQSQEQGTLCFARTNLKNDLALQRGSLGFFQHFANGILKEPHPALNLCGFLSDSPDIDGYAQFILDYMKEIPEKAKGQWLKHSDRKSLFSQLPIEKRI